MKAVVLNDRQTQIYKKFMKFSNVKQIIATIEKSPHADMLERFSELNIDENYVLDIIKILANINDRVLVGVLYHASINEVIMGKTKRVDMISILAGAIGARQAYEAVELILKADYEEELILEIIKIIVKSKNEFTANAAKKVALTKLVIEHDECFQIIEIVAQLENKFSDIWNIVSFIKNGEVLKYKRAHEVIAEYSKVKRNQKFIVKNIIRAEIDGNKATEIIGMVADYKSLSRLQGANKNMFNLLSDDTLEEERELIYQTFNHFKEVDDEFSLFSCAEFLTTNKCLIKSHN